MKVGYLGPGKSTFGFMAAEKFFAGREDVEFVPFPNHTEICQQVGDEEIDYGVVAVENVIEGVVTETLYALDKIIRTSRLLVSGEVEIPIELFFLRKPNDGSIPTKLFAHKISRGQCSKRVATFVQANEGIKPEKADSNGEAAEEASKNPSFVAIGTAMAEKEYGLVRLSPESIADNPENFTRFWIVGTKKARPTTDDKVWKTCLLVSLNQEVPGGICKTLAPFAERRINLLLIAPVPIRKWEYSFMMEFEGNISDPKIREAYEDLCRRRVTMDAPLVLGSYPAGTTK